MLATLINDPFDDDNWFFEIKWDGYRAVSFLTGKKVELVSRNNIPFTGKYIPVAEELKRMDCKAVLDGEIIALNNKGLADFQILQNWQNTPSLLQYHIFDIIWKDGYDLSGLPLEQRKMILKKLIPRNNDMIKYSDHIVGNGTAFFKAAMEQGLEGIMAKKASSTYVMGARTGDWVKIKVNQRQEVVIAGFTQPRNTRKFFGSLLLGIYDKGNLIYVGHTGSGFNSKSLQQVYAMLRPLIIKDSPFVSPPKTNMPATWVKPELVCEIKFTEWTKNRNARHPIFMGLREDKKPADVIFEKAKNMASLQKEKKLKKVKQEILPLKSAGKKKNVPATSTKKNMVSVPAASGKRVDPDIAADQVMMLNKRELKLTNLNKPYWKKEKFSKGDMMNYYLEMVPYILPYMLNRPQSLNRHPNGINGPSFYQKDVKGKVPDWIETYADFSESTGENVNYLVCSNEATLIYMANLGCIEMHPWHSRVKSPLNPDWCLIDLDPDKTNSFDQVIEAARVVKEVLDSLKADSCVKTSGSSGIHIFVPLGAKYNYDQSRQLAQLVVTIVHQELPLFTSLERNPSKRKGKIYLDFLQNRETQTAAAPYSLRPKPGVPVSAPLHWTEVKKGLTPLLFNARNIFERLKTEGDLFKPVLGKGINLEKVLKNMQYVLK